MRRPDRPTVDTGRLVERLCFLLPPVIGVGVVGVLQETDPGVPLLGRGLFLLGTFGYVALSVILAAAIVLDAHSIRTANGWDPNPGLYGVAALAVAPLAGVIYLARRHRALGTAAGPSWWWTVVAFSLATTLIGFAAAAVGAILVIPELAVSGVAVAGAIAVGTFPIAIHQDAAYLTERTGANGRWRPNPGVYLGLAFLSLSLPPLQPVLAGYYLWRRRRALAPTPRARTR